MLSIRTLRHTPSAPHPWVPLAIVAMVSFPWHGDDLAWAQASPHYRLAGGGLASCTGPASAAERALVGESGTGAGPARSSSASADLIGGFIGEAFPSRASVTVGTSAREFISIAFPLRPSDNSVASVLDELGEPDVSSWRLGHWSPGRSAYVEALEGGLSSIERGQGYWLITAEPTRVVEEGLAAPIGEYQIPLEDGPEGRPAYNQLGNPFLFPIAVSDLMVTDGNTIEPLTSPKNTLTEAAAKVYESDAYVSNPPVIPARTAFWVKKLATRPVSVIVPYRAGNENTARPGFAKPAGAEWAVAVSARQGSRAAEPIVVGAASVPAGQWNALCLSRAPDPPGGGLGLSVHEGTWGRLSGDYVRVFRSAASTMSWDLATHGVQWPGELSFKLDAFDLPAGSRMWLSDLQDGWTREASSGHPIIVPAKKEQQFRLTVALDGPAPGTRFVDGLRDVYPNPFRRHSGLVFTLASGGTLQAKIYDVSGRCVRGLSASTSTSGERVLVWDGRDDAGRITAPGVYLARYRVGHVQGVARLVKIE